MTPANRSRPGTIPEGRTPNQPVRGFCRNPECRQINEKTGQMEEFHFIVDHDAFCCPKCKADRSPLIGTLVNMHLLVRSETGQIRGKGGLRYSIPCELKRSHIATASNEEAGTDQVKLVNCEGCLEAAAKMGIDLKENPYTVTATETSVVKAETRGDKS